MNQNPSWFKLWQKRIAACGYTTSELWDVVVSHACVYARLAALEQINIDQLEYEEAVALLRCVNPYMPNNRHLIVACDQLINALNLHIDELERDDAAWQAECRYRHAQYQYDSYFSGR